MNHNKIGIILLLTGFSIIMYCLISIIWITIVNDGLLIEYLGNLAPEITLMMILSLMFIVPGIYFIKVKEGIFMKYHKRYGLIFLIIGIPVIAIFLPNTIYLFRIVIRDYQLIILLWDQLSHYFFDLAFSIIVSIISILIFILQGTSLIRKKDFEF